MPLAQTRTGRIHVESHGDGPPLLVVPGFGATTRAFRGLLANLTERDGVILYDMGGMGQSGDLDGEPRLEAMVEEAVAVI